MTMPMSAASPAKKIVDGRRKRRRRRRLAGARLEVDAEVREDVVGVREHVHEVGDRRALVSGQLPG